VPHIFATTLEGTQNMTPSLDEDVQQQASYAFECTRLYFGPRDLHKILQLISQPSLRMEWETRFLTKEACNTLQIELLISPINMQPAFQQATIIMTSSRMDTSCP
jgi:hypothetical protein